MKTSVHLFKQKLHDLGVTPEQWTAISNVIAIIYRRKRQSVRYRAGDFLFVAEGLLKQVIEGATALYIERFLPERSPIFISWTDHGNDFVAIEDSIVLKIDAGQLQELRRRYPALTVSLGTLFEDWMNMLKVRMDLLALPKHECGPAFRERFPELAGRISIRDLAAFLLVSEGYLGKNR